MSTVYRQSRPYMVNNCTTKSLLYDRRTTHTYLHILYITIMISSWVCVYCIFIIIDIVTYMLHSMYWVLHCESFMYDSPYTASQYVYIITVYVYHHSMCLSISISISISLSLSIDVSIYIYIFSIYYLYLYISM